MFLMHIRRPLGQLSSAVLLFLFPATCFLAAPLAGPLEQQSNNARDIAVIDRALATLKPGQKVISFGDVGITPKQLRAFRQRLVTEQSGSSAESSSPNSVMPPGTTFKWPAGIV